MSAAAAALDLGKESAYRGEEILHWDQVICTSGGAHRLDVALYTCYKGMGVYGCVKAS